MKRRPGPLYDFWHPRVEGQIRDCMNAHPEWFAVTARNKKAFINSLAKRIVGEIAVVIADCHGDARIVKLACGSRDAESVPRKCASPAAGGTTCRPQGASKGPGDA